jgi:hypothetical protein
MVAGEELNCANSAANDTFAVKERTVLDDLRRALGENAVIILLAAVVLAIAVAALFAVLRSAWGIVADWYKRRSGWDLGPLAARFVPKKKTDTGAGDDIEYPDPEAGKPPAPPSGARIKARLAKLKALYAPYNRAITDYVAQTRDGALPDDLIDERILSRKDDDFEYTGPADPEVPPKPQMSATLATPHRSADTEPQSALVTAASLLASGSSWR